MTTLHKKWSFPWKLSSVNVTKSVWPVNVVTFNEEILNGKIHFLSSVSTKKAKYKNLCNPEAYIEHYLLMIPLQAPPPLNAPTVGVSSNSFMFTLHKIYPCNFLCFSFDWLIGRNLMGHFNDVASNFVFSAICRSDL